MGAPSKFTSERRTEILRALGLGASHKTAAAYGGISETTLERWLARGKTAPEGSSYRRFYEEVAGAKAKPNIRALEIIHEAMLDKPDYAWKFLQVKEQGFAPPMPNAVGGTPQQIEIVVRFADQLPQGDPDGDIIEGEVIELEPNELPETGTDPSQSEDGHTPEAS